MGAIKDGFNSAFRDYNTDGVSGSGNRNTPKSDARALGATIEANVGTIETYAATATAALRRANGSSSSPTAIALNDVIGAVDVIGYHSGGAFSTTARARMRAVATEAWTASANGVKVVVSTTPNGSTTPADRVTIDQDGTITAGGSLRVGGALGYSTGAGTGGTVTQATDKTTGVTLNKLTGKITMSNANLASSTSVGFTLTNSFIEATDVILVCIASGAADYTKYHTWAANIGSGSCQIVVRNVSGGNLSEALVLNFVVIKGASS